MLARYALFREKWYFDFFNEKLFKNYFLIKFTFGNGISLLIQCMRYVGNYFYWKEKNRVLRGLYEWFFLVNFVQFISSCSFACLNPDVGWWYAWCDKKETSEKIIILCFFMGCLYLLSIFFFLSLYLSTSIDSDVNHNYEHSTNRVGGRVRACRRSRSSVVEKTKKKLEELSSTIFFFRI